MPSERPVSAFSVNLIYRAVIANSRHDILNYYCFSWLHTWVIMTALWQLQNTYISNTIKATLSLVRIMSFRWADGILIILILIELAIRLAYMAERWFRMSWYNWVTTQHFIALGTQCQLPYVAWLNCFIATTKRKKRHDDHLQRYSILIKDANLSLLELHSRASTSWIYISYHFKKFICQLPINSPANKK
jgi:hypothetical protein